MPNGTEEELEQEEIIGALQNGSATDDSEPLKRMDTHMSRLFLSREHAYKLIRRRRHPFADMTPLAARRRACEVGLSFNRRLAPQIYEAILPVVSDQDGRIKVGGRGVVLDWVVKMRRFPDGALFKELAATGRLTPALIGEVTETIADFHAALPASHGLGTIHQYRQTIAGLRKTEGDALAAQGGRPVSEVLFHRLEETLLEHAPMIEARRQAGWVRRGHGDLHLGNVCLFEGHALPFDGLDFDPSMATTDVLYDVAFLFMDLRARGLDALANVAMNTYWDASGQTETSLALLPLFMALRATVRMAIATEADDRATADIYRDIALDMLKPTAPCLLAIGGLSGTGKSTLAKAVAPGLPGPCGARLLRTDTLRKAGGNSARPARLPDSAYTPRARAAIYRVLTERARAALAAGSSVVADATFLNDRVRANIRSLSASVPFLGIWLRANVELRVRRVAARRHDASDATAEIARNQVEPTTLGPGWRLLDASLSTRALADQVETLRRTS